MDIVWERRKMTLYIGTNYHPHDWPREQWEKDFARMKEAGVGIVTNHRKEYIRLNGLIK